MRETTSKGFCIIRGFVLYEFLSCMSIGEGSNVYVKRRDIDAKRRSGKIKYKITGSRDNGNDDKAAERTKEPGARTR